MTMPDEQVKVIQADREAAKRFWEEDWHDSDGMWAKIDRDSQDSLVQALARHRQKGFESGRKSAVAAIAAYHERQQSSAWREESAAQADYNQAAGERAAELANWHGGLIEHLRHFAENPGYFGPAEEHGDDD